MKLPLNLDWVPNETLITSINLFRICAQIYMFGIRLLGHLYSFPDFMGETSVIAGNPPGS